MIETQWGRWLSRLTGESSERAVAKRVGVSHTTVQRWVRAGVPPSKAYELCVRFKGDMMEVMVLLGRMQPHEVEKLNWAAIVQYAPADVLASELQHRAARYVEEFYPDKLRKTTVVV